MRLSLGNRIDSVSGASKPNGNPSALTALVVSNTQINLSWVNNATNQDGAYVFMSTDGGNNYTNIATVTGTGNTYNKTGLTAYTEYYFKVVLFKGSKLSEYSNIVNKTTFTAEYAAVYAAKTYKPDTTIAEYENSKVKQLIDAGFWAEMDVIRVFSSHSAVDSLLNWKDPSKFVATVGAVNGATWVPYKKWYGALTGNRNIDHNYNPKTQGVKFVTNSASMGFYSWDDLANDVAVDMGARDSGPAHRSKIQGRVVAGTAFSRMNQDTSSGQTLAISDSIGLICSTRNASGLAVHKGKNHSAVQARTLTDVPNQNIYSLAYNNAGAIGGQSSRGQGFSFIGGYISNKIIDATSDIVDDWMAHNLAFPSASDLTNIGLSKGGVVLQFYDYYLDSWLSADSVLSQYGWKATFFTSGWSFLTTAQRNKIKQLDTLGHEIASHTYNNTDYQTFIEGGGTPELYVTQEILPDIAAKEVFGITPIKTFGPVGYNLPLSTADIIFSSTQIENIPYLVLPIYDNPEHAPYISNRAYKRATGKMVYKEGNLDATTVGYDINNIMALLAWAKDNNEIVFLEGHDIVEAITDSNQTLLSDLVLICDYIKDNNMGFYTPRDCNALITKVEGDKKPYSSTIGLSGNLAVGQTLSFSTREEDDRGLAILLNEYQWWRADDNEGTNKVEISGATLTNYILQAADEGKYIRCGCRLSTGSNIGYWAYSKWFGAIAP